MNLQSGAPVESLFKVVKAEALASFEHLSFELLEELDVFAPAETRRTRDRGLARLWLRPTVKRRDRCLSDLVDEVSNRLVEQATRRGLLDLTDYIDSTGVPTIPAVQDASKCYDPTAQENYYSCTTVLIESKVPIAAEFTESKQVPEKTAMHVTRDVLAVATPIWMVGDSAL